MNQKTNLNHVAFLWRYGIVTAIFLWMGVLHVKAQMIDFSNGTGGKAYVAEGYTDWYITEQNSGGSVSGTFDGVTITIGHNSSSVTVGNKLTRSWYNTWTDEEMKLVHDGIYACMSNDDNGSWGATVSKVAIDLKITGLPAGTHSLQAYHNFVMNTGYTLPTIGVAVNGTTVETGIVQSQRADTKAACAKSYVTFEVASANDEVTITYFSEPIDGTTYTTTYFFINALEFDVENASVMADTPYPTNMDYHVNADDGTITLGWTPAEGATSHTVYFGTDISSLTELGTTTSNEMIATGLNPLQNYYWRVDETVNGTTYTGEVWSFRPRRLAFPGADGAGKYAIGGRGGVVYHVTSLADDGMRGTLRYGLESLTGPRTIVFDVGGVIQLTNTLTCSDSYVTIAGQTAPGIGIMLRDHDFGANSNDGITRFMRFRYGHGDDWNETSANQNTGNAAGLAANYGIMDHCLLGWGSDETFSSRGAKNITFQRSLIGESLNQNGHKNYWDEDNAVQHGYAASIGGEVGSFHHNLLAHNEGRNWSLAGGVDGVGYYSGKMNIYNNVCYNWCKRATDGGTHQGNFVNNYYKKGPSTTQNYIFSADLENSGKGTQEYYLSGNLRVSQDGNTKKGDTLNDTYRMTLSKGQTEPDWDVFVSTPYDFWSLESHVETAEAAFRNVLSDVGCNYESLDNNEARLVQETRDGTYTKTGSRSGLAGQIDKESDSEGWNGLGITTASRDSDWDTDQDGIPDWFETVKGWSTTVANNNECTNSDYYTNLEEYLNWMACPHFIHVVRYSSKQINLSTYFAGYTNPTYTIGTTTGLNTSLSGATLTVTPTAMGLLSLSVTATEDGVSLTRVFNFHVVNSTDAVYNEYSSSEIEQEGNITWALNLTSTQTPAFDFGTSNLNSQFTTQTISYGTHLTGSKTMTIDTNSPRLFETLFQPSTKDNSANETNDINFYVTLNSGYKFIPTSISVTATRYGTDGGKMDISWVDENGTQSLITGVTPYRNSGQGKESVDGTSGTTERFTIYTSSISNAEEISGTFGIKLNLYSLDASKTYGFKDVIINGTLIRPGDANVILKERATTYSVFYDSSEETPLISSSGVLPAEDVTVTLYRTLSNSYWNTFCVPFDIPSEVISSIFGGGEVLEFTKVSNESMIFTNADGITAGVPCLFKPTNSVSNPIFTGVTLDVTPPQTITIGGYSYIGHYVRYEMNNSNELYLATSGALKTAKAAPQNYSLGLRATFMVPAGARQSARVIFNEQMVSEGLDVVDGLQAIEGGYSLPYQPVYNMQGQKVGTTATPLEKGLYIVNGKKVVIQ